MKKIFIFFFIASLILIYSQPYDEKDPRAIIEKVKIYRLTQELDLTTEQAMEFFPKLIELRDIEKDFNKEKLEILSELKDLINRGASDDEITKVVTQYEDLHRKKLENQFKKMKEIWSILTPVQRAKYLIFEEQFNREIREMIKQVKKIREPFKK